MSAADEGQGPNYGGDRGIGNKNVNTSPAPTWNRWIPKRTNETKSRRIESHGSNHPWSDKVNSSF